MRTLSNVKSSRLKVPSSRLDLEDLQLTDRKQTLEAPEDAPNPLPRLGETLQALLERVALGRLLHGYDAPAAADT